MEPGANMENLTPKQPKGILDFIEHPLTLTSLFALGGLVGTLIYTPFYILCAVGLLLGLHRSGYVSTRALRAQVGIYVAAAVVLGVGGYFLYGLLDAAVQRVQDDFARKVAAFVKQKSTEVKEQKALPEPRPSEPPKAPSDKKEPSANEPKPTLEKSSKKRVLSKAEMAALTEGDLIGAGPIINDGKQHGFPMLQIGETTFIMTPNGVRDIFPFFPDSGVRIEWGAQGWPLVTTTVRDRNGNLVVEVLRNHWRIYPAFSSDKNYTKDTLEVKDTAGHVVLQIRILPDKICLLGEWWDVQGNGVRLMKPAVSTPTNGSHVIRMNRQMQHLDELIAPIFEYPGKDHLGEFKEQ